MRRVMREILVGGEDGCDGEDQMKTWIFAATLLLVVFAKSAVFAAKLLTPKPQLEKEATHIVVGKVRSISSTQQVKGEWGFTNYVAEIAIDKVEKGEGLKAGDDVQVRYYSQGWRGSGSPPAFYLGHSPRPNQDDSARAYLVNHGYNGEGYRPTAATTCTTRNRFYILVGSGWCSPRYPTGSTWR